MKVFVTGGAGFIGSNLIKRLIAEGHEAIAFDNLDDFYDVRIKHWNLKQLKQNAGFQFIQGDIRDEGALQRIFAEQPIDVIVHLAAKAGVRPSIQDPGLYYDVNVTGTQKILHAALEAGISKVIFASSSSIYGNNRKVPFAEHDQVDRPISPYAATKKAGELMCFHYHHLHQMEIFCLRFFTAYGPRQRPEMAISNFTRNILEGKPIRMFGDGSSARDYTYIDDIVDGVLRSIHRLHGYEVINLGESQTITLKNLIRSVEEAVGKKAMVQELPMQPGDVQITYADISKAKSMLGYQPSTDVVSGIKKYVAWYQDFAAHWGKK